METMKKKSFKIIAITLVLGLVLGTGVGAYVFADQNNEKEENTKTSTTNNNIEKYVTDSETVYLVERPNGSVKQTIVSEDGELHYDGYENCTLPVTMGIKYYLDGKEISAKDLAGKSGHVKIAMSYTNNLKVGKVFVPFMVISGMILDNDNFSNVNVVNGRCESDGSRNIVVGYSFPGMQQSLGVSSSQLSVPSSVTVTADVKNFALDTIYTVATSEVFSEMDLDNVADVKGLKKTIESLSGATTQLTDALDKLYTATDTLQGKTLELSAGAKTLQDSCETLSGGLTQINAGMTELNGGLAQLSSKSATLNGGAKQIMSNSVATADAGLKDLRAAFTAMGKTIPTLTIENYNAVLSQTADTLKAVDAAKGTNDYQTVIATLTATKTQLDSLNAFYQGVLAYTAGVDNAHQGSEQLAGAVTNASDGAAQIAAGMTAWTDGSKKLADAIGQLNKGVKTMRDQVKDMEKNALKQVGNLGDSDIATVIDNVKAMGQAAKGYKSFGRLGSYDSVKFIYRTEAIGE